MNKIWNTFTLSAQKYCIFISKFKSMVHFISFSCHKYYSRFFLYFKNEIILFKSLKYNSVEGCDINRINEIANRVNRLDFFSDDQNDFATSIFSELVPTNLDKEGRFLIPEYLKEHANITSHATFIGQGYFFQICKLFIFFSSVFILILFCIESNKVSVSSEGLSELSAI